MGGLTFLWKHYEVNQLEEVNTLYDEDKAKTFTVKGELCWNMFMRSELKMRIVNVCRGELL